MGTETIWVNGKDKIRFTDDTNTYRFVADDKDVIKITMDGNNTVIVLEGHGTIRSNGDLRIHLDENQATAPTVAKLKVFSGSNVEIFSVNEQGEVDLNGGQITTRNVGGVDAKLIVGPRREASLRGRVEISHSPETTGFGHARAGVLVLYDKNENDYFLWVDTAGKLRISDSDPADERNEDGDEIEVGQIVGQQRHD